MVLSLYKCFVVPEQVLQLLHGHYFRKVRCVFFHSCPHKLSQSRQILLKLGNHFLAIHFKRRTEQLVSDCLDLVLQLRFRLQAFCALSCTVHILLQLHNVQ